MKFNLLIVLIFILATLTACRSDDIPYNDAFASEITTEAIVETTTQYPTVDIVFEEWEYELEEYILLMSDTFGGFGRSLRIYNKSTGETILLGNEYLSIRTPAVSPNRTQLAYLDSHGYGHSVHVYNLNSHEEQIIDVVPLFYDVSPEDRFRADGAPRSVVWLDDNILLIRMSNMHGSARTFSEILYYNIENDDFDRIFVRERYTDFFTGMEWNDDVLNITVIRQCEGINYVEREEVFEIERCRVHELINNSETMVLSLTT